VCVESGIKNNFVGTGCAILIIPHIRKAMQTLLIRLMLAPNSI
jgi:hypothetical protein